MNSPVYFEIQAEYIPRAKRFYGEVFGWRFVEQEDMEQEYWRIETEGISGGLLERPVPVSVEPNGVNAFICSMEVADFDSAAEKIVSHGGEMALPKFAVPGTCWQGYFLDPEGNTFGIFEADEGAI